MLDKLTLRSWAPGSEGCQAVLDGEYDIPIARCDHPVILDIGANIGSFAVWAAARFPGASIFCYEPNPECLPYLRANTEGLDVTIRPVAVWLADGKMPLYAGLNNLGEASLKRDQKGTDPNKCNVVKVCHARHLPECDILKLDIEGTEYDVLANYPHLSKCKFIMLEWHSVELHDKINALLEGSDFVCLSDKPFEHPKAPGIFCNAQGTQTWIKVKRPKLFLSVLTGGGKTWNETDNSIRQLGPAAQKAGLNVDVRRDAGTGVDRARNRAVAAALADPDVTHFMFLDDDIVFDPFWVLAMVKSDLDVVGGAYPRKTIDWKRVHKAVKDGVPPEELHEYSTDWIINTVVAKEGNGLRLPGLGTFIEVEEVGTGFLMVKRAVLEKMRDAYSEDIAYLTDYEKETTTHHMMFACQRDPACDVEKAKRALTKAAKDYAGFGSIDGLTAAAWSYDAALKKGNDGLGRYLTEDYAFCRLWRLLGGRIYIYTDASVGHIGVHRFEGAIKNFVKAAPAQVAAPNANESKVANE